MQPRFPDGGVAVLASDAYAPLERGSEIRELSYGGPPIAGRWIVSGIVFDPAAGTTKCWTFDEDDLEPATPVGKFPPPLHNTIALRLYTDLTRRVRDRRHANAAASAAERRLRELIAPAVLKLTVDWHFDDPSRYDVLIAAEPAGDALAAFEALVSLGGAAIEDYADEGWAARVHVAPERSGYRVPA